MTEYADHLVTSQFNSPVRFRIAADDDVMLPSYDIGRVLRERYGLDDGSEFDVALFVDEPRAEFAFDADAVNDAEAVLDDVRELLEQYNEPPKELSDEEQEEWRATPVRLADVSRQ